MLGGAENWKLQYPSTGHTSESGQGCIDWGRDASRSAGGYWFVKPSFPAAVNRWVMQERASAPDGPTLFDPLELRVEPIAATIDPQDDAAVSEREASEARDIEARVDDITAELVRLLEEGSESQPPDRATKDKT
jgi:hypothetical protein